MLNLLLTFALCLPVTTRLLRAMVRRALLFSFLALPIAMLPAAYAKPFTAQSDLALLSERGVQPRRIDLKAFDPHREAGSFSCRHQAERMAAPTPAAQALHEEAMALSSPALWPNERNWPRAMVLWQQAAQQGHWKAALMWLHTARKGAGVNSEKGAFKVEPQPAEVVVAGMEALMRQGLGDAFFWMGEFHRNGYGVRTSTDRAWAFWELAADLGSPLAQTRLAKALPFAEREQEKPDVAEWANRPYMYRLLECAHAQGHGLASYELGSWLNLQADDASRRLPRFKTPAEQYAYALKVLHEGVKFGSEKAAGYLSSSFRGGDPLVDRFVDKARGDRYTELAQALWHNPDLRFPNLDRVLPLPPAKLPPWDGEVESLIKAAQAVRAAPGPAKTSQAPSRARVPEGYALAPAPHSSTTLVRGLDWNPQEGSTIARAPRDGYYQPVLRDVDLSDLPERLRNQPETYSQQQRRQALADAPPLFYKAGEPLSLATAGLRPLQAAFMDTARDHEGLDWRYVGQARPASPVRDHLAQAGLVQPIAQATDVRCADGQPCPSSGIWQPEVSNAEHPLSKVFNATLAGESWRRQAFVLAGRPLPSFAAQLAPVLAEGEAAQLQLQWRLMVGCALGFEAVGA